MTPETETPPFPEREDFLWATPLSEVAAPGPEHGRRGGAWPGEFHVTGEQVKTRVQPEWFLRGDADGRAASGARRRLSSRVRFGAGTPAGSPGSLQEKL